jgi:hypothetical protein
MKRSVSSSLLWRRRNLSTAGWVSLTLNPTYGYDDSNGLRMLNGIFRCLSSGTIGLLVGALAPQDQNYGHQDEKQYADGFTQKT